MRKIDGHPQADVATADLTYAERSSVSGREVRLLVFGEHVLVEREEAFVLLKDLLVAFVCHRLVKLGFGSPALEDAPERLGKRVHLVKVNALLVVRGHTCGVVDTALLRV